MEENRESLVQLADLLWSIGETLDEMDRTGKKLWSRIEEIDHRIRIKAEYLPDSGQEGEVREKIRSTPYLYLGWSGCVDVIENIIGRTNRPFSEETFRGRIQ